MEWPELNEQIAAGNVGEAACEGNNSIDPQTTHRSLCSSPTCWTTVLIYTGDLPCVRHGSSNITPALEYGQENIRHKRTVRPEALPSNWHEPQLFKVGLA
eukprot:TRINITY_DN14119_c0_g1_i2.p2 TRINITY_DN14119_c0_g1~~TRINITY_DN14119_c0_g1_i2.p2  ORF type:complete len:100 (-),score=10.76 TRINITY_DN14119_c0_g1_i2:29-328(-)